MVTRGMFIGLVNAHTGVINRSWNNIQFAKVPAVIGNENIGIDYVDIDVEQEEGWAPHCTHRDEARRIEVASLNSSSVYTNITIYRRLANTLICRILILFRACCEPGISFQI